MEPWITYVIAPIAIALVSWILGKNGRRIDETSKVVGMLQNEISRLARKVEQLEQKLERKDDDLERKSVIIQAAFECRTPSSRCPVLICQSDLTKKYYDTRIQEQQPREHPPQPDDVDGADQGERQSV